MTIAASNPIGLLDETEAAPVRDSMPRWGGLLSVPLTLLTGKPHTGEKPRRFTPGFHVAGGFASMGVGVAISASALHALLAPAANPWWGLLLPLGWAVTLHGMRNLRMMAYHQAAHRNLWARSRQDRLVGSLIAALLMVQDFDRYRAEHVSEHHASRHMTVSDPTVQAFLIGLKLRPGLARKQMWRRLLRTLINPVFHLRFFIARVRSYFTPAPWRVRLATVAAYALAAILITWQGWWAYAAVCWLVPLTVPFQISNTLRLCVKHTFPSPETTTRKGRDYFAGLTNGIFIGEEAPRRSSLAAWARWWARMLAVHLPSRYLVLTGDTVCHDFHHRRPMNRNWGSYIYARQADIDSGHRGWPPYKAAWGLIPAINVVFESLRVADPDEYNVERIAQVSDRDVFTAFDD